MKRALTFLFAVVSCWTVSFVQAANVGLDFYSGVAGESVSVAEDLHYAVVSLDGETVAQGDLNAENKGRIEVDVNTNEFNVVVEQASTKFFGSVTVTKDDADELFFVLDASGVIWLKNTHACPDDAECMKDGVNGVCDCCDGRFIGKQHNGEDYENGQCCDDDCCDADCICRKLGAYLAGNLNGGVGGSEGALYGDEEGFGSEETGSVNGQTALQGGQSSTRNYQGSTSRVSTSSSTLSNSPYSYGASNFGSYGSGPAPYRVGGFGSTGGTVGAAGGLSSLGMLGMIGAVIAVSVTSNSNKPVSTSNSSVEQ